MKSIIKTGMMLGGALLLGRHSYPQSKTNHLSTNSKTIAMETIQSQEKNKEAIRNLYENILNNRKFELLKDIISEDYTNAKGIKGAEGFQEQILLFIKAVPDVKWKVEELAADGNKVIIKHQLTGTHTGQFQSFAASGKRVSNTGFGVYEFHNGKIINNQVHTDRLGFLQEIGILPTDLATISKQKEEKDAVSLIDKIFIPKNSIEEFNRQLHINRSFIKTLPGFIRYQEFGQKDAEGNLNFISVAFWENQNSIDSAKAAAQAEFKRIGFNAAEFFQRLNIKLERGIFSRYND